MNCKPGDLAVIVKLREENQHMLGRLVRVVSAPPGGKFVLPCGRRHEAVPDGCWWIIEFPTPADLRFIRGRARSRYAVVNDSALRPIRDPGDDAVDETLLRLPAPTRDEVAA